MGPYIFILKTNKEYEISVSHEKRKDGEKKNKSTFLPWKPNSPRMEVISATLCQIGPQTNFQWGFHFPAKTNNLL